MAPGNSLKRAKQNIDVRLLVYKKCLWEFTRRPFLLQTTLRGVCEQGSTMTAAGRQYSILQLGVLSQGQQLPITHCLVSHMFHRRGRCFHRRGGAQNGALEYDRYRAVIRGCWVRRWDVARAVCFLQGGHRVRLQTIGGLCQGCIRSLHAARVCTALVVVVSECAQGKRPIGSGCVVRGTRSIYVTPYKIYRGMIQVEMCR